MAYAERTYTSASGTEFALTNSDGNQIYFIKEDDISVYVNNVEWTNAASGTSTYTISTDKTKVNLNSSVSGVTVLLRRVTAIQDPTVTYTAGSTLTAIDLNNADDQIRFGLQEFSDTYASLTSGTGTLPNLGAFLGSSDTWVSNNSKAATTGAIDGRVDSKIATAFTGDIIGTAPVSIADNTPSSGKITISVDAELTELATMATATAQALADLSAAEVQIIDGATLTTTELNYVDGVTSAIQTQLDNKQPIDSELSTLATMVAGTAQALKDLTQAEVQILDGATVTTAELNVLDGIPSDLTATELGYVDGVTSSIQTQLNAKQASATDLSTLSSMQSGAATELASLTSTELDILDGATLTTTELNYVDGVTSEIQTQLNNKQGLDNELTVLSGMQPGTASILANNTALAATTTEINSICENRSAESSITAGDNTKIPTSGAVSTYVSSAVTAVGGFKTIATEVLFPNTQPANGVVISVSDAGGLSINSSGVVSGATRADGTAVTINSIPDALKGGVGGNANPHVLADGMGLQVTSTGSSDTYTYQKVLATEADVAQLSGDINDFNERYRVSNGAPSGTDHAGDLYFDTGTNKMLVRNAANNAWSEVQSVGNFYINTISSYSGTGGNSASFNNNAYRFVISNPPTYAQQLIVSINGVIQKPNSGTSQPAEGYAIDGSSIIFAAAPPTNSPYFIVTVGTSVNIGTPSDNTVDTDILMSGAVTDAKVDANAGIVVSKLATFVTNNADNRVITGSATKNTLNGESTLTYDGNTLTQTIDASGEGVKLTAAGNHYPEFIGDANRTADNTWVSNFAGSWNGNNVGSIGIMTGDRTTQKDNGQIAFYTSATGSNPVERLRIIETGELIQYEHLGVADTSADDLVLGDTTGSVNRGMTIYSHNAQNGSIAFADNDSNFRGAIQYMHNGDRFRILTGGVETFRVQSGATDGLCNFFMGGTTNNHNKTAALALNHYTFDTYNQIDLIKGSTASGSNLIEIGGSGSGANSSAATEIKLFTAANATTNNGTERLHIHSGGDVEVSSGNLVIGTGGKGIDFSAQTTSSATGATAATSAGDEVLDHYERGIWTPIDASGQGLTLSNTASNYIRVGNMVYIQAWLSYPSNSNSSAAKVGGLPFPLRGSSFYAYGVGRVATMTGDDIVIQLNSGGSDMYIYKGDVAQTNAQMTSKYILMNASYITP